MDQFDPLSFCDRDSIALPLAYYLTLPVYKVRSYASTIEIIVFLFKVFNLKFLHEYQPSTYPGLMPYHRETE